jgi:hypothetical protein
MGIRLYKNYKTIRYTRVTVCSKWAFTGVSKVEIKANSQSCLVVNNISYIFLIDIDSTCGYNLKSHDGT